MTFCSEIFLLYLPEASAPGFTARQCSSPALSEAVSEESLFHIQAHKTAKCFRFDVTTARCHLGACCCQLFPPQTLCHSTRSFAGRLSSCFSEPKSTSQAGNAHMHCLKSHKQTIPSASAKHLQELFSLTGEHVWLSLRISQALSFACVVV